MAEVGGKSFLPLRAGSMASDEMMGKSDAERERERDKLALKGKREATRKNAD